MKQVTFTFLLFFLACATFAQTTYYWVGGTSNTWLTPANWNTALNGSGSPRSSTTVTDILIIDGTNIGGANAATGAVSINVHSSNNNIGQVRIINGANVSVYSTNTNTAPASNYKTLTLSNSLQVDASSSFTLMDNPDPAITSFLLMSTVGGTIYGNLSVTGTKAGQRLGCTTAAGLVFKSGSVANVNNIDHSFSYDLAGSVVFESGSTLNYNGGSSPLGNGSKNEIAVLNSGSTYSINFNTTAPFLATRTGILGNIVANGNITSNRSFTVDGNITIKPGKTFTLASGQNLTISNGHVVTEVNTSTGEKAVFKLNNVTGTKVIPVGIAGNALTVTATPSAAADWSVTAFQGVTSNGLPNGTALNSSEKARLVNVIWDIKTSAAITANVSLNWTNVLEGADFANYTSAGIGVAQNDGSGWGGYTGSGDNVSNQATVSGLALGAAAGVLNVGNSSTVLPVRLLSFEASTTDKLQLKWRASENNLARYVIRHSTNGVSFRDIASVDARNLLEATYSYIDFNASKGTNYYRLMSVDKDGSTWVSAPLAVDFRGAVPLSYYPNPVSEGVLNVTGLNNGDTIKLLNLAGAAVLNQNATSGNETVSMNSLVAGAYFLIIENAGKVKKSGTIIKN